MENYNPNGGGWQDALFQRDPRLDPRNFIPGQMQVQAMQNQSYNQQPYPVHQQLTTSHTWRNNVASTHPNHPSPYCNNLQAFSGNKSTRCVPLVQVPTYPHYCNQVLPTLHQFESTHSNVGPGPGSHLDGLHEQGPSSIIKRVPLVPLDSNTLHVSRKSTSEQPTRGKPTTQALIRKALSGFFAENQSVGLRPYCRANNMASNHASIYLIVRNNDTLKVLIGKQGKGGFDRRISRAALRVVNGTGEKNLPQDGTDFIAQVKCVGLDTKRATKLFTDDPVTFLTHYANSMDKCHAKKCSIFVPPAKAQAHIERWTCRINGWQCLHCATARKSLALKMGKLKPAPTSKPGSIPNNRLPSAAPTSVLDSIPNDILPSEELLKEKVEEEINLLVTSIESVQELYKKLQTNRNVVSYVRLLKERYGITAITCKDGTLVQVCSGLDPSMSCNQIFCAQKQERRNTTKCRACVIRQRNSKRSEDTRTSNWNKQVAADSHVNHAALSCTQKVQRRENKKKEKVKLERKVVRLERNLDRLKEKLVSNEAPFINTDIVVHDKRAKDFAEAADTIIDHESKKFKDEMKNKLEHVLENWDGTYQELVEETLFALLEHGVDNEKKGKNSKHYKFEQEDAGALVNFMREQMSNQVKVLCGKKNAVSFSVDTYQWTNALCSSSKSRYRHMQSSAPFIIPSVSSQEKVKTENRVPDGRNTKVYETHGTAMLVQMVNTSYSYIMTDEVQIKNGVKWHSFTGKLIGIENDMLDLSSSLHRLLSEDGGEVQPAKKANQWLVITFGVDGYESWVAEFFFNNGSLTGDTIFNQFLGVVLKCEAIGCQVLGCVMDAGGSNARFVECYQRHLKPMPRVASWLDDDEFYIKNPHDPSRRLYVWFCITHLFKAVRNALLHSQPGGSRAFLDANDCPFGWTRLIEFYEDIKNRAYGDKNANNLPRLTESVVYPLREKKMDVGKAKVPFEHKTIAHLIADSCTHELVNLTCKTLRDATADAVSKNPFRNTVDIDHHGAQRHGEHVEQVRYMQGHAYLREGVKNVLDDMVSAIESDTHSSDSAVALSNNSHTTNHPITVCTNSCHLNINHPLTKPALSTSSDSTPTATFQHRKQASLAHNPYTKKLSLSANTSTPTTATNPNNMAMSTSDLDLDDSSPAVGSYSKSASSAAADDSCAIANPYVKKPAVSTNMKEMDPHSKLAFLAVDNQKKPALSTTDMNALTSATNLINKKVSTIDADEFSVVMDPYSDPASSITTDIFAAESDVSDDDEDLSSQGTLSDDENSCEDVLLGDEFEEDDIEECKNFDVDGAVKAHVKRRLQNLYSQKSQERLQKPVAVSKIHSELATLEYLAVGEALFTNMLMNKDEKFTAANFQEYKAFLKRQLTYFEQWREAALKRQKREGKKNAKKGRRSESERSFLSKETFRNLRIGVSVFINLVGYLLDYLPSRIPGFTYIPMQISNQTPLEGLFSVMRAYGFDNADFGTGITNKSIRSLFTALKESSYDENDLVNLKEGWKNSAGSAVCSKFGR